MLPPRRGARPPPRSRTTAGVDGPKMWRHRRANSRRAASGSISGGGTTHSVGCRAPSTGLPAARSSRRTAASWRSPRARPRRRRTRAASAGRAAPRPGRRHPARVAAPRRRRAAARARRSQGRPPRRRTRCTSVPTAGRATGPPMSTVGFPRHARGSRATRLAACCPGDQPTPRGGASAGRAGAARRARRPSAGRRGPAPGTASARTASRRELPDRRSRCLEAGLRQRHRPRTRGSESACPVWREYSSIKSIRNRRMLGTDPSGYDTAAGWSKPPRDRSRRSTPEIV